jgi:crotonobetainyl-CoA:carnitine CoA-transferase CaiB-like acyl-CoA transferase
VTEETSLADGPLTGLRPVEFGQLVAGPWVGTLLADFGADVINVEAPPKGDALREWGRHRHNDHSLWWSVMARELLVEIDDEVHGPMSVPGVVPKLSVTPGRIRWSARWEVGADTEAVLGDLDEEVEGLDLPWREGVV